MSSITMNAKDAISAPLAECFVTIEGNRYNFMQAIDLEATMEKNKTDETFLVTGNQKHFPQHPKVVTPAEMLRILDNL